MRPRHAGRIRDDAKGIAIPPASEVTPRPRAPAAPAGPLPSGPLEPFYDRLPPREQRLHAWAAALPSLDEAETSQKQWSAEYFAKWAAASGKGSLGAMPLIVLTRARGEYGDGLDVPGAEIERVRLESQRALAELSTVGTQQIIPSGHNMHLEATDAVCDAVQTVVAAVRKRPGRS